MADFGFSEAQEMFRTEVSGFVRKELMPDVKRMLKATIIYPELMQKLARANLLSLFAPEEYGGQNADYVTMGIACEEVSRAAMGTGIAVIFGGIGAQMLSLASAKHLNQWLPSVVNGDVIVAACFTEPEHGSDLGSLECKATWEGDHYVINGEKTSISFGNIAKVAFVWARTGTVESGARGVSVFILPTDIKGLHITTFEDMGCTILGRASFIFDNVRIPVQNLIGEENRGFYMSMRLFDWFRPSLSLMEMGNARQAVEDAIEYAKTRVAFGRPIAKFEAVSFRLMESLCEIEAGRLLAYKALWVLDNKLPKAAMWGPAAKAICVPIGVKACRNAMVTLGHVGYSTDYPAEQRLRDAYAMEFADGTEDIQLTVVQREAMGKQYLAYV